MRYLPGGHDSLADELAKQLVLREEELAQLKDELEAKRTEIAHLRVELREENAA